MSSRPSTSLLGPYTVTIPTASQAQSSEPMSQARIPRPPNCFMLYRADKARVFASQRKAEPGVAGPRPNRGDPTKRISQMWKNESPAVRRHYQVLADQKKIEHATQYPDYRYRPRRGPKPEKGNKERAVAPKRDFPPLSCSQVSSSSASSARAGFASTSVSGVATAPASASWPYSQTSAMAHGWDTEQAQSTSVSTWARVPTFRLPRATSGRYAPSDSVPVPVTQPRFQAQQAILSDERMKGTTGRMHERESSVRTEATFQQHIQEPTVGYQQQHQQHPEQQQAMQGYRNFQPYGSFPTSDYQNYIPTSIVPSPSSTGHTFTPLNMYNNNSSSSSDITTNNNHGYNHAQAAVPLRSGASHPYA